MINLLLILSIRTSRLSPIIHDENHDWNSYEFSTQQMDQRNPSSKTIEGEQTYIDAI